jgi:pyruvate dehydrogenase E2 component (dihydrolipoamide acetyltransferase)
MWGPPNDPQIYGAMEIDATNLKAFMEQARAAGHRVTPTHVVGRAVAVSLHEVPDFNVRIRGSKMFPRETVDVFFITAVEGGRSLSGVRVDGSDHKPVYEIARELTERATAMKQGNDPEFAKTKKTMETMPMWAMKPAMRFSAWVAGDRDRSIKALGVKSSPFGAAMITSVGMFGLPLGFAPLARFYKMGLLILVGEIADKPLAIDGKVRIRPVLPITATIDHRYADGWHISQLLKPFRAYLADPASFEPPIPAAGGAAADIVTMPNGEAAEGEPLPDIMAADPASHDPAAEDPAPAVGP